MYEITDFEYIAGLIFDVITVIITIIAIIKGWN